MVVSSNPASKPTLSPPNNNNNNNNTKTKTKEKSRSSTRTESDAATKQQPTPCSSPPSQRTRSPGVRFIRGRIYDSENGKCCHQCRQKTMDFVATCKNQSQNKQCTFRFCHKCLLNRYGEKAEEVEVLDDWKCPKCRGICNCSCCMKKRGCRPTGILVRTAKATGYSSVSEMLHLKDSKHIIKDVGVSSKKQTASNKERAVDSTRKHGKRNGFDGKSDSKLQHKRLKSNGNGKKTGNSKMKRLRKNDGNDNAREGNKDDDALTEKSRPTKRRISKEPSKKEENIYGRDAGGRLIKMNFDMRVSEKISPKSIKIEDNETEVPNNVNIDNAAAEHKPVTELHKCEKNTVEVQGKCSDVEILLPQGIELNNIASIDIPAEDVGHALQFLEFCNAFGQVLGLKKGQPELLLRELARGRSVRRSQDSSIIRFHIQLLSMIQKDSGKRYPSLKTGGNSWLQALSKCISESQHPLKELQLDCFDIGGGDGYDTLNSSKKLRLLSFLCDEALGTADLRSWIDEYNSKFVEGEKKAKEKVIVEKEKERNLKKKLQDEVTRAMLIRNGAPFSISEHEDLVSKIKTEVAQTLAETLEATDMVPKKKQLSDAVRSEPILFDGGHKFWKLRGYPGKMDILLQDVGSWDSVISKERWFVYDVEQKAMVEKYISSLRK